MPIKKTLDSDTKFPIHIWSDDVEQEAISQLKNIGNLPFIFKHVAVMPDVHWGMGATVGSVIATKGAVCPAAVGVDIGCGMMAVKTNLNAADVQEKIKEIRHSIERSIPVGFDQNTRITDNVQRWAGWECKKELSFFDSYLEKKAIAQLGSLGGGNHFIEICLDTENNVWIMLHSGSRNLGKVLAERHIEKAKDILKKMFIELPDPNLAYFAKGSAEFISYVSDIDFCQKYAMENRVEMMRRILKDISHALFKEDGRVERICEVNCHHNYLSHENHYGENVLVTRKGAVSARSGEYGIIPGSMGTRSYIVRGLGNPASFNSCSHGAGRLMSRKKARQQFTKDDLVSQTTGVECRKDEGIIDEIPGAYKDIDQVMGNQSDLVQIVATLKQIMCIKG